MNKYDISVVDYPAKSLIGTKVRTTMAKAHEDCSALWLAFSPRSGELQPPATGCTGSFGISIMVNAEDFDYWAAVEAAASSPAPEGMARVDVPAGRYAKYTVPNLEKLAEAYMYLYETWPKSQSEYACGDAPLSFEWYPPNWQPTDALEIFMPVKKV